MGKIFTRLMPGLGNATMNGIDFDLLLKVLTSLPGTTTIVKIDSDPNSPSFRVDAENPNFQDGTEIQGMWGTVFQTPLPGHASHVVTTFQGVTIIDPKPPLFSTGNGTVTLTVPGLTPGGNYHYSVSGGGAGSAHVSLPPAPPTTFFNLQPHYYDPSADKAAKDTSSCVCGAASVGGAHSSYCGKK